MELPATLDAAVMSLVAALQDRRPESLLNFSARKRLPVILQAEATECGLACLAMIAAYHGYETDIVTLRRRFAISGQGANLKGIMDLAGRLHLSTRALRLEVEQMKDLQLPAILHWNLNHFVVLKAVSGRKVIIHDPAVGERKLSLETLSGNFTGVALELTPTEAFEQGEQRRVLKLSQFWTQIRGLKRSLLQIFMLALLLQVCSIVSPYYMQTVVDDVLLRNDENLLLVLALGFGLLLLIQIFINTLREFVILYLSSRLSIQMAANLFRHLIRLPMDYFYKRHMGDVVSRFGSLDTVQNLLTTGLIAALVDGVLVLITLGVMLVYSIKLSMIVIAAVVLYAILRLALYRQLRMLTEESIVAKAKLDSHFMESIRAAQTIKLFQKENDRQGQWQNHMADSMNRNIQVSKWNVFYDLINSLITGLENLLVVYFAAMAVMGNVMTIGMLYAFMSYKNRFVGSMSNLVGKWIEWKMLSLHLERLSDIAFTPAEAVDSHSLVSRSEQDEEWGSEEQIGGEIEVQNLGFRYSDIDQDVFSGVSFTIKPGEAVVITGPSGCGKTTLMKCLMGLLTPTEGKILIDGQPIDHQSHYRSQIAAVMQDDRLMSGSVADNIACFSHKTDMDRIRTCARQGSIHREIMTMPMQYNTLVGDMGTSLSGGQYQRILLARALYRKPRILFLDEATSHLDIQNEAAISHHVRQLSITRIVVAHRQETVASADRKIDMANMDAETG